jgi:membrane protease YdiL (CAAX protease family)
MNELIPHNLPLSLALALCLLPFVSVYALCRIRQNSGAQWLRWNKVAPLPFSSLEMISILGVIVLAINFFPVLLPTVAAACAFFFTKKHGLLLADQWGLGLSRYPACIRCAFNTYLAGLTPFLAATLLSFMFCQSLGYTDLVQNTVKEFQSGDRAQMIKIFLLATLFAPFWEEMVFRGIVYPWLKSKVSQKYALILSALLFASIHNHLPAFFPLALFGLALALVYEYTGSLVSSIVLHALFNFATCLNLLLMRPN